jgi:hypothetical protein
MEQKTYVSDRSKLSINWERPSPIAGKAKNASVEFVNHRFVTSDEDTQKFIESLPSFKNKSINIWTLKDDIEQASVKAVALRAVADEAVKAAVAAEKALAALSPKEDKPEAAKAKA